MATSPSESNDTPLAESSAESATPNIDRRDFLIRNAVIGAATIRCVLEGVDVLGIRDGFQWVRHGAIEHVKPRPTDLGTRIHFPGGPFIGTARANPPTTPPPSVCPPPRGPAGVGSAWSFSTFRSPPP